MGRIPLRHVVPESFKPINEHCWRLLARDAFGELGTDGMSCLQPEIGANVLWPFRYDGMGQH